MFSISKFSKLNSWLRLFIAIFSLQLVSVHHIAFAKSLKSSRQASGSLKEPATRTVVLDSLVRRGFETAMESISKQGEVTIIAEGVPLHATLSDRQLNDLKKALPEEPSSIGEAIVRVAFAFDYETEQTNNHTFLLRKRYSDENDLPCVTYAEIVHALHEILAITGLYGQPHNTLALPVSEQYYRSLTEEQKQRSISGLGMSDLAPEQQTLAVEAAGDECMGSKSLFLLQMYRHLLGLRKSDTVFTWMTPMNIESFGYEGALGPTMYRSEFPLDHNFRIYDFGYEHVEMKQIAGQAMVSDLTIPTDLDRLLAQGMLSNRLPSTMTLAEAARSIELNYATGTTKSAETNALHVGVDLSISGKPISLYGAKYSNADNLVRSMCKLYELELLAAKEQRYDIILPTRRTPVSADDYTVQIKRLIPAPLLRQFGGLQDAYLATVPGNIHRLADNQTPLTQQSENADLQSILTRRDAEAKATNAGYYPAVRRLLVLARQAMPFPTAKPMPVSSMNPEVLRLIGLMLYSSSFRLIIRDIQKPPARCLLEPNRLFIKIEHWSTPDGPGITCQIGYKDDAGVFHCEAQPVRRMSSLLH